MTSSPPLTKTRLPHVPELDGLRGCAALVVFVHHFLQHPLPPPAQGFAPLFVAVRTVFAYGRLGVDVFFVLSGFLITALLLIDRAKTHYFHNFYWKRALRILPVYLIYLGIIAVMQPESRGFVVLALFFIANFASRFHIAFLGVAWTLSIEEQFYLLWPQFVRRMGVPLLYYTALILFVVPMVLRALVPLVRGGMDTAYTFYRCDGLALGALLALQWFTPEGRTPWVRRALAVINANATLAALVAIEVVVLVFFPESIAEGVSTITTVNLLTYRFIRRVLERGAPFGAGWLAGAVPVYLGAISYSMYMFHSLVLGFFDHRFGDIDGTRYGAMLLRFAVCLAVTVAACTLSRYALELPIQSLRRFVLKPGRPDPAAPGSAESDKLIPVVK